MKILQVAHRYPPQTGGVETHVKEISERLVERGHDVTVFSADATGQGTNRERRNGVIVRRHRAVSPGDAYYVSPQIAASVRTHDADVVHVHNYHAFPALFATLGSANKRVIFTTHYHGKSASPVRNWLLSVYTPFGGAAVRRADEVIAVSGWERRQLAEAFGVDATIIPNGIDTSRFTTAGTDRSGRPYLLCVGRLIEYKGVQHAIRALPELEGYDLLIAGAGTYKDELERVASEVGVSDRTAFLGYVPDERLPDLYADAAAHLALSEYEAYGMTVAESLTAGTPCVVRMAGALSDWTSTTGCVGIDSVTPMSVAAAVEEVAGTTVWDPPTIDWSSVVDRVLERYTSRDR
jgi:glycosyltransferase involved in cell wall biosynthesis